MAIDSIIGLGHLSSRGGNADAPSAKAVRFLGRTAAPTPQDIFNGGSGNETYTGTSGADTINGNGGNDILAGAGGGDTIDGGDGNDFISSHLPSINYSGDYWIYWQGISADTFADHDTLTGGLGDDILLAGYGDSVDGGSGQNWLYINLQGATSGVTADFSTLYNGGSITIGGGTITNIYGVVNIQGSEFDDTLKDFAMSLSPAAGLYGRGGDDNLTGGSTVRVVDGGEGNDTINVMSSSYLTSAFGGDGADTINGRYGVLYGDGGNDTIYSEGATSFGGAGNDHLIAGKDSGNYALHGDDGDDEISTLNGGAAQMYGGAGADILRASERGSLMATDVYSNVFFRSPDDKLDHDQVFGGAGGDFVSIGIGDDADGAGGTDYLSISFRGSASGITLNTATILGAGAHAFLGGTISNFENIEILWGSNKADTLVIADQTGFAPTVYAGDGNDTVTAGSRGGDIRGEGGDDVLNGSTGSDQLDGGAGRDELRGGEGTDEITIRNAADLVAGEVMDGGTGTDYLRIEGPGGNFDFSASTFTGIEQISGNSLGTVLRFNVAQLTGITSLSIVDISLADAGSLVLNGVTLDRVLHFYLSAAGNTLDLRGTVTFNGTRVHGNSGNDIVYGTAFADVIQGGGGEDWIDGGAGIDNMSGGDANDTYVVDNANDIVTELADQGYDTVRTTLTNYTLGNNLEDLTYIGSLAFTGNGNDLSNYLRGGAGDDTLKGFGNDDWLYGAGGNDTMIGGVGNDRYYVDDLGDVVTELAGEGTDAIYTTLASYTLGSEFEDLTNAGLGTGAFYGVGNAQNNMMTGANGSDTLLGMDGNDTLDGRSGADNLYGGAGDDDYYLDDAGDLTFEDANGGYDEVFSSLSQYLYANVEGLTLTGVDDVYGVGNELVNDMHGNSGANLLIGGGGGDYMFGGGGADSIYGQDGSDLMKGGGGIDYIVGGAESDRLYGDDDADALYGEDGDDILYGGDDFKTDIMVGGNGNDTLYGDSGLADYDLMEGGSGNDKYYVDTGDDLTFEAADGGTDTVYANVAGANNGVYLYANVENLVLLNVTKFGVGNELANTMTGSASGNWLLGGAGNDILNGKAGNDVLFGEGGADRFVFEQGTGGDVIGDFAAGTDKIDLSAFSGLTWQTILNSMHENGGTTAIDLQNGDLIVLNGVAAASLSQADFILSTTPTAGVEDVELLGRQADIWNTQSDATHTGFLDRGGAVLEGGPALAFLPEFQTDAFHLL